jgi:hypothetical protein
MNDEEDQDGPAHIGMEQLAHGKPVNRHQEKRKMKPQKLKS